MTIIIGLSGGPDSLCLSYLLAALQRKHHLKLIAAHLDHQWRETSYNDLLFCKEVAQRLNITFVGERAERLPQTMHVKGSKEATGRAMRRHFLQSVAETYTAHAIALGHHAQDQQETFLLRLVRGTTLSGLCGMKERDGLFIRPLLRCNKSDIISYLDEHNISYLVDPSNESPDFLRNRIRKEVLPALRACDDRFDHNFSRTQAHLVEAEAYISQETEKQFASVAHKEDGGIVVDIKKFLPVSNFMQKRMIIHWLVTQKLTFTMTEKFIDEILHFLKQPEGKEHTIHHQWSIQKKQHRAWIVHS